MKHENKEYSIFGIVHFLLSYHNVLYKYTIIFRRSDAFLLKRWFGEETLFWRSDAKIGESTFLGKWRFVAKWRIGELACRADASVTKWRLSTKLVWRSHAWVKVLNWHLGWYRKKYSRFSDSSSQNLYKRLMVFTKTIRQHVIYLREWKLNNK